MKTGHAIEQKMFVKKIYIGMSQSSNVFIFGPKYRKHANEKAYQDIDLAF